MSTLSNSLFDPQEVYPHLALSRREVLAVLGTGVFSACRGGLFANAPAGSERAPSYRVGVSLAGAEFGAHRPDFSNRHLGVLDQHYTYPNPETIRYFTAQGLGLFRIPFRWERVQPQLGQALHDRELGLLRETVRQVHQAGGRAILDLHNYGRYCLELNGKARAAIVGEKIQGRTPVSENHLGDVWRRLAKVFRGNPAVVGYGIMNEPHDMRGSNWKTISQHVVDEIRLVDRETHLLIAGDGWSNAHRWTTNHTQKAWIKDPVGLSAYEAHCYFDADASGKYQLSFQEELARDSALLDRGVKRVSQFLNWCQQNRVAGFLGEFGIPRHDPKWRIVLKRFLQAVSEMNFPACYWAAGEWWGEYPLSIQPENNFRSHAPQLGVLQQFLKKV